MAKKKTALAKTPQEDFTKDVRKQMQDFMRDLTNNPMVPPEELKRIASLVSLIKSNPTALKIEAAKNAFQGAAEHYVKFHLDCVRALYHAGEFAEAARHAEWAMERIGKDGLRLIEKPGQEGGGEGGGGHQVYVGVNLGGERAQATDAKVIDVK